MKRLKKILRRLLFFFLISMAGLAAGYYTAPIVDSFGLNKANQVLEAKLGNIIDKKDSSGAKGDQEEDFMSRYISAGKAIEAVKASPYVETLLNQAEGESDPTVSFSVYQKPEADKPLWLIKVSQRDKGQLPQSWLYKVNALNGQILNFSEEDLYLGGIRIGDPRKEVENNLGKPLKIRKSYDSKKKETVRTMEYEGLTITAGNKSGVTSLRTDSPQYPTTRELRVGDTVDKLYELYGEPENVIENQMVYALAGTDEKVFYVKAEEGTIVAISIEK